ERDQPAWAHLRAGRGIRGEGLGSGRGGGGGRPRHRSRVRPTLADLLGHGRRAAAACLAQVVVWSAAAVSDLGAIRAYIEQFNPAAALSVATALLEAADTL